MSDDLLRRFAAFLETERQRETPRRDVASALDEWAAWLLAGGKAQRTVDEYRKTVAKYHSRGLDVLALDAGSVIATAAALSQRLRPRSLAKEYSALRSWAEFTGQSHAVGALRAPTIDATPEPLPPSSDVARVRDAMRPSKHAHGPDADILRRDGAIFDLLFDSALRISEALALRLEDLSARQANGDIAPWTPGSESITHVRVIRSKRNKSRTVPLTPTASRSLTNWVSLHRSRWMTIPGPYLFTARDSAEPLSDSSFRKRLAAYGEAVCVSSLAGRTHNGRRVKITNLIARGAKPSAIIRITGHKSVRELEPYIVLSDEIAEREWLEKS